MIETEANEAPEAVVYEAIRVAHETNMEVVKFINTIVDVASVFCCPIGSSSQWLPHGISSGSSWPMPPMN